MMDVCSAEAILPGTIVAFSTFSFCTAVFFHTDTKKVPLTARQQEDTPSNPTPHTHPTNKGLRATNAGRERKHKKTTSHECCVLLNKQPWLCVCIKTQECITSQPPHPTSPIFKMLIDVLVRLFSELIFISSSLLVFIVRPACLRALCGAAAPTRPEAVLRQEGGSQSR